MAKINGLYPDLEAEYKLRVATVFGLAAVYVRQAKDDAHRAAVARWRAAAELVVAIQYDQKRFARDTAGEAGELDAKATEELEAYVPDGGEECVKDRQNRELGEALATLTELEATGMTSRLEVDELIEDGIVPAGTIEA